MAQSEDFDDRGRKNFMNYHIFGRNGFLGKALSKTCRGDLSSPVWINCAARVMGIGGNRAFPAKMLSENLSSAIWFFDKAIYHDCRRVVNFGSTCAYSPEARVPFQPKDYMVGEPEITNYGYAIAKRTLYVMSRCYGEQYGMDNLYLVMPNLYGPGCHFGKYNHVIPDMIEKVDKAIGENKKSIEFFGSGTVEREFLYVEDAAKLVLRAISLCHTQDPVHLTSGQVITIKGLAALICEKMGFEGEILWNSRFPDGQKLRKLQEGIQLGTSTSFSQGITNTIQYYKSLKGEA